MCSYMFRSPRTSMPANSFFTIHISVFHLTGSHSSNYLEEDPILHSNKTCSSISATPTEPSNSSSTCPMRDRKAADQNKKNVNLCIAGPSSSTSSPESQLNEPWTKTPPREHSDASIFDSLSPSVRSSCDKESRLSSISPNFTNNHCLNNENVPVKQSTSKVSIATIGLLKGKKKQETTLSSSQSSKNSETLEHRSLTPSSGSSMNKECMEECEYSQSRDILTAHNTNVNPSSLTMEYNLSSFVNEFQLSSEIAGEHFSNPVCPQECLIKKEEFRDDIKRKVLVEGILEKSLQKNTSDIVSNMQSVSSKDKNQSDNDYLIDNVTILRKRPQVNYFEDYSDTEDSMSACSQDFHDMKRIPEPEPENISAQTQEEKDFLLALELSQLYSKMDRKKITVERFEGSSNEYKFRKKRKV